MSIYDQWHKARPAPGDEQCREHGKGKTKFYPTVSHGKGDRWQVRWRDENGKQRKRNFAYRDGPDPDKHAAAFDAKIKRELDTGTSLDLEAGQLKVRDYSAAWRKDLLHRDSTAERLERVFRLHVNPLPLGNVPMVRVRPSNMRSWVKDRSEVLAPSTLAVVWANVTSMFAAAVADRAIGISPCTGVTLPEIPHHKHYIPTEEQVHVLSGNIGERYSAAIYTAAGCGFRGGEITGMEEDAIDFAASEIDVTQQLVCITGQKPYLGPPKTKTSARTVKAPAVTMAALKRHLEEFPPVEVEIWDRTNPDKRKHHVRTARLVFTLPDGRPIHRATWAHIWRPAARAAGIPLGTGLHSLRHYFATLLIHNGASVKRVQLALGHSTPTVTLNTYVGEWPDTDQETSSIVDAALGDVPRMCLPAPSRGRNYR
jgi:integrase